MGLKIVETGDRSHSLYSDVFDEKYHSLDGAWTESMYVYIEKGLLPAITIFGDNLKVFEFGFGTGLNAFQTAIVAAERNLHVTFHTVEKYPVDNEIIVQLNYAGFAGDKAPLFDSLHSSTWDKERVVNSHFTFFKQHADIVQLTPEQACYHVIYFDAFAPNKQPEVWTQEVMQKLYDILAPGGILVTYCAQGEFKRRLKAAGFAVERLPGPPGKREMTRATRPTNL